MMIIIIVLLFATTYAIAFRDDFPTILVWRTYLFFGVILMLKNISVVVRALMGAI